MIRELEPFQIVGGRDLAANPHHLLGDEPGLGKTLQALYACHLVDAKSVLVVCPASVRGSWHEHIEDARMDGLLADGKLCRVTAHFRVISYDGASGAPGDEARASGPYDAVIMDESHFLKSVDAQRTRVVLGIAGLARLGHYKWPMSGTPLLNRPVELYPILKTLHPVFSKLSYTAFTQRYCGSYFDGRAMNVRGASRVAELAELLKPFVTRRTKKQVYPDRKAPLVTHVAVELSDKQKAALKASGMEEQSAVLKALGLAKLPHTVKFVREQLQTVEKIAVYAHHREVIEKLAADFQDVGAAVYWGGMGDAQKASAVAKFQGETCRVFIGQRQAAGVGINGLQRVCSTIVIAEPSWVPGETQQIIDRLDRIGQAEELVNAYLLYAAGTDDDKVRRVHDRKKTIVGRLVDGAPVNHPEEDFTSVLGDLA